VKRAVAGLAMLASIATVAPARAEVIEVSTSVAADADQATVKTAVERAVAELLGEATTFTPTLVVLTRAVVVGGRLHVRVLLADESGEQSLRALTGPADALPALPRTDL
jgi:hypothetical protein